VTPIELTDGVVALAPPTLADVERITDLCQDETVSRWTTIPTPYNRRDALFFIGQIVDTGWADATTATWGIRSADDSVLHGMVSIELGGDGEIGFWMGRHARGRGWTTRASQLAVDAAFAHGLDHVRWKAIVGNTASRRVAEKLGFRMDGTVRRLVEQRGSWHDGWIATLLPDDVRADGSDATATGRW
jgi:RimJ/RimL family protein N-acetyltransferase